MSVIILLPDGMETIRPLLQCLQAQTVRRELELIIVSAGTSGCTDEIPADHFAAVKIVNVSEMRRTAHARAAGIRAATSPIIVLTEDHSWPAPDWAESLIQAHRLDWAVVGPAVKNGNPRTLLSWANFLIEYSEWLDPAPGGIRHHLPGHNSSYKTAFLQPYLDDLEDWMESESLLHWDMEARGHRLCLEPSARTRHLNFSRFLPSLVLRFQAGRLFAGMRRRSWGRFRRALYAGAFYLIPLVRLSRIWRELFRRGRPSRLVLMALPWMLPLLAVDAIGEMAGYLWGPMSSADYITRIDFHRDRYMCRKDRAWIAELQA